MASSSVVAYAHSLAHGKRHDLVEHLREVAKLAAEFAAAFGGEEPAFVAGLWHDLGKFTPEFQSYLRASEEGRSHPRAPHAFLGASLIYSLLRRQGQAWEEIALPIAGHHAGLNNPGVLEQDLISLQRERGDVLAKIGQEITSHALLPRSFRLSLRAGLSRELFIRMIFSALVDADFLNTEEHFHPEQTHLRESDRPKWQDLWQKFEADQEQLLTKARTEGNKDVNLVRKEVYDACKDAAATQPGVFRLTVPTGGGKTRSSLAFALKHAIEHDLRQVIVAIPYTSIIDQTAKEYREILGEEAVLEHHSQIEVPENEDYNPDELKARLASENWDAPLIVTTTVQLFESLFSNRPSKVRKLHNLAKSIVILDEVQMLPVELLKPTLSMLRTLVEEYGVSVVLCTATQPAFDDTPYLQEFAGLKIHEIVPQHPHHFKVLRRVEYESRTTPLSWDELAGEVRSHRQVMVILNTRPNALSLLKALGEDDSLFHLSTLLCGAHRRARLAEVRDRLKQGKPVRLISTQVVEAGVNLDFPVVYRAVGPLDRIVQAAGRCNREGLLPGRGKMVIFEPAEGGSPRGPYKVGIEKARFLLVENPPEALHDPELYREYFRRLFSDVDLDKKQIQSYREVLDYRKVADLYKLIEEDTIPVVVPYQDAEARLRDWQEKPSRHTWQRLQPFLVSLYRNEASRLEQEGWLELTSPGLYRCWPPAYNKLFGLSQALLDPADLMA